MKFFENLLAVLEAEMTEPTNYGWFHLMFVAIVIAATVFLCWKFRDCSDRTFRGISLGLWLLIVVLEIYKQFVYTLEFTDGAFVWDYQWYAFPYQLCSTPLYALPFVAFLPNGKIHDAFIFYMSFFSLFGGIAVFFYPNDVFISTIGINVQTMIHHGLQIVLGIFFTVHERKKLSIFAYLRSAVVFAGFLAIAIIANIVVYHIFAANGIDETFNMFYISPYFECTLPVLSSIYPNVPFIVFILIYSLGFLLVAFLLYLIQYGICALARRSRRA